MSVDERAEIRLELVGLQRVIAGLSTLEGKLYGVSRAEEAVGRRGFLMNQALFTARRLAYAGTLTLIGLGAAATKMGFAFNASMESNSLAFKSFLGSEQAARRELNFLYDLAAKTPFEFTQLALGARQLMAFGMTAARTNVTLTSLADAMSAMGLSNEAIDRATLALGQIQSSGRLLGQDLRQLEQLGLVDPTDLARRLGIDPRQIGNIGALNVPSDVAIDAIVAYWEKRFHGAAKEFQHTFMGQVSTIHDYAARLFGMKSFPLFRSLETTTLPHISKMLLDMTAELQRNPNASWMDLAKIADRDLKAGGRLVAMFRLMNATLGVLFRFVRYDLIPALRDVMGSFPVRVLFGALLALSYIIDHLIVRNKAFKYVLEALITIMVFERLVMLRSFLMSSRLLGMIVRLTMADKLFKAAKIALIAVQILYNLVFDKEYRLAVRWILVQRLRLIFTGRLTKAYRAWVAWMFMANRAQNGGFIAGYKNNGILAKLSRTVYNLTVVRFKNMAMMIRYRLIPAMVAFTAEVWASTVALLANPITWIVLAVLALTAGLVILYFKWKRFHNAVDATWHFLMKYRSIILAFLPFINVVVGVIKVVQRLYNLLRRLYNMLRHPLRIRIHTPSIKGILGKVMDPLNLRRFIPGGAKAAVGKAFTPWTWAAGGIQPVTAPALVGESGPELVTMPAGARITPIGSSSVGAMHGAMPKFPEEINLRAILRVDGRDIAEVVSRHRLDRSARR